VDIDVTPLPIGAQAEGSERTWMGRNRSKTGRTILRWTASAYREMLHETLLRGKVSAVPALTTALGELETRLGWTRERRQRIVLRLDGDFGTTEVLHWLRSPRIRSWPTSVTAAGSGSDVRPWAPGGRRRARKVKISMQLHHRRFSAVFRIMSGASPRATYSNCGTCSGAEVPRVRAG
jgi:hypothetical protein